jgi:hypothetical protein
MKNEQVSSLPVGDRAGYLKTAVSLCFSAILWLTWCGLSFLTASLASFWTSICPSLRTTAQDFPSEHLPLLTQGVLSLFGMLKDPMEFQFFCPMLYLVVSWTLFNVFFLGPSRSKQRHDLYGVVMQLQLMLWLILVLICLIGLVLPGVVVEYPRPWSK